MLGVAGLLLGSAEVVFGNAAQSVLPALVPAELLAQPTALADHLGRGQRRRVRRHRARARPGRVNSVYRMLGWGLRPAEALAGGFVAHAAGLRVPYIVAGITCGLALLAAVPLLLAASPELSHDNGSSL